MRKIINVTLLKKQRTNPSVAALEIDTRKQLRMEELEIAAAAAAQEQEMLRSRNRSGKFSRRIFYN